ncbi:MAG: outer membrane protein assembly factor BamA [Betaproteobacteria bacterium]|nr:outer membrane protein assembly factor BamA [Betaproteobacteria bacterium]
MKISPFLRLLLCASFLILFARSAAAFDPFVVRDIRVEGIQRIEAGTVFSYLPVKVGETMSDEKASAAIRALFGTGFFRDVRIEVERDVLIVVVEERPAIASIDFVGMKEFEKDPVKKALRETGLQEGRIFDRALLDRGEQEIKRQYLSRGKYGVQITTTVTPLERNRVAINFNVEEGEVARIKSINVVGNQAFREKDLLDLFVLRTPGWLTWYTKNDQYSRQKLQGDIESLRSYYQNRGYLDFSIESTQVSITPDRQDIYITINISEGEKYTVTDVKLDGELIVPEEELRRLVTLKPGEVFSREKLTESTKKITDRLGNDGYAFANANAVPELDKDKRTVGFTILVDPGRRVYVRRINIVGNTRTRDEVARRELRQLEGAFYDAQKLTLSKQRIDKTLYFSEVEIETPPVAGSTDQVDVTIKVKEKPTGSLILGLGFSNAERIVVQGGVQQANFAGSGKTIGAQVQSGKINRTYSGSYTDPYYTVDGVSRGFDIYSRRTDASSLNLGNYRTSTVGGGVRFGIPFTEIDGVSFGLSAENTKLDTFVDSPARYQTFQRLFGNQYAILVGSGGWARDSRDSALWPTQGRVQRASAETSLGNLKYYKTGYQHQWYYPVTRDLTLMLNGEVGIGGAYGGKEFPFFKNYYMGGVSTVRGYYTASLGPRDTDNISLGGTRKVQFNSELLFPLPGAGLDRSVRISTFLDGGSVFGAGEKISGDSLRYSAGLAVAWSSPLGPLKINFAYPLNDKPGDRLQKFQFLFGQVF